MRSFWCNKAARSSERPLAGTLPVPIVCSQHTAPPTRLADGDHRGTCHAAPLQLLIGRAPLH